MPDSKTNPVKVADSAKLNEATKFIAVRRFKEAKVILASVIRNVPSNYSPEIESDKALTILLWDVFAFGHYTKWKKATKTVFWISAIYPPAFYYLGYIAFEEGDYLRAIEYYDQGAALEPENPKFMQEKAQALVKLGKHDAALKIYDQISSVGPFVSERDVAASLRGRGYVLIEKGRLSEAELALNEALRFEPNSQSAQNELKYIAQMKLKGARNSISSKYSIDAVPTNHSTKKSWQFWK